MLPSLVQFCRAFIVHETSFDCRYVEPFQSYALPIDGGVVKFEVFPTKLFRGGRKIFESRL